MITSMTGFGRGEVSDNGMTATVEIKSLNSRFLDLNIRLPQRLQNKELLIKEMVQSTISRGKLNVTVHLDQKTNGDTVIQFDENKVKAYSAALNQIKSLAGIDEDINLRNLLGFSDIFSVQEDDEEVLEHAWELIKKATENAIEALSQMRMREGGQLKADLENRIQIIEDQLVEIEAKSEGRVSEAKTKLHDRIKSLVEDEQFDQDRLELEIAIMVDKMDITEETVRLRSHLKFFLEATDEGTLMGRRLNFLTQEMNRELNTIGSKSNNSEISHHVVKCKESLEQIREQVQNIE